MKHLSQVLWCHIIKMLYIMTSVWYLTLSRKGNHLNSENISLDRVIKSPLKIIFAALSCNLISLFLFEIEQRPISSTPNQVLVKV